MPINILSSSLSGCFSSLLPASCFMFCFMSSGRDQLHFHHFEFPAPLINDLLIKTATPTVINLDNTINLPFRSCMYTVQRLFRLQALCVHMLHALDTYECTFWLNSCVWSICMMSMFRSHYWLDKRPVNGSKPHYKLCRLSRAHSYLHLMNQRSLLFAFFMPHEILSLVLCFIARLSKSDFLLFPITNHKPKKK